MDGSESNRKETNPATHFRLFRVRVPMATLSSLRLALCSGYLAGRRTGLKVPGR